MTPVNNTDYFYETIMLTWHDADNVRLTNACIIIIFFYKTSVGIFPRKEKINEENLGLE